MYLLDTNVLSELRKVPKGKADPNFLNWVTTVDSRLFFINSIVLMEQRKWALSKRHMQDEQQALLIEAWIDNILTSFEGRILSITPEIGLRCAELHIPNPKPAFDSLIAATALAHQFVLVTRNSKDFEGITDLKTINPFLPC